MDILRNVIGGRSCNSVLFLFSFNALFGSYLFDGLLEYFLSVLFELFDIFDFGPQTFSDGYLKKEGGYAVSFYGAGCWTNTST
jgi:hypothetical protein